MCQKASRTPLALGRYLRHRGQPLSLCRFMWATCPIIARGRFVSVLCFNGVTDPGGRGEVLARGCEPAALSGSNLALMIMRVSFLSRFGVNAELLCSLSCCLPASSVRRPGPPRISRCFNLCLCPGRRCQASDANFHRSLPLRQGLSRCGRHSAPLRHVHGLRFLKRVRPPPIPELPGRLPRILLGLWERAPPRAPPQRLI